jgi:hypothetical protein
VKDLVRLYNAVWCARAEVVRTQKRERAAALAADEARSAAENERKAKEYARRRVCENVLVALDQNRRLRVQGDQAIRHHFVVGLREASITLEVFEGGDKIATADDTPTVHVSVHTSQSEDYARRKVPGGWPMMCGSRVTASAEATLVNAENFYLPISSASESLTRALPDKLLESQREAVCGIPDALLRAAADRLVEDFMSEVVRRLGGAGPSPICSDPSQP